MVILFVCAGNTCRSPLAEGIGRKRAAEQALDVVCRSRGLAATSGDTASKGARMIAAAYFINLCEHCAQPLTETDLVEADAVYTMTARHAELLCGQYPHLAERIAALSARDIEDPWGGDLAVYDRAYRQIEAAVRALPCFTQSA